MIRSFGSAICLNRGKGDRVTGTTHRLFTFCIMPIHILHVWAFFNISPVDFFYGTLLFTGSDFDKNKQKMAPAICDLQSADFH